MTTPSIRSVSALLVLAPAALIQAGCTGEGDVDDDRIVQTGVVVAPAEFLGDLPCAQIDGAPQSYVATVVELASELGPERLLGPANPVSCGTPVVFHDIVGGRTYGAQIAVYDRPADQVVIGQPPIWETTCGLSGAGSAEIVAGRQTRIRGCTPIEGPGNATTSIVVDATSAAGALGCSASGGLIGDIVIIPLEPASAMLPDVTIACGQPAVVYAANIEPGTLYAFRLEAAAPDGKVYGARCTTVAREGLGVPASCTLLIETGSLAFPVPEVVADSGLTCGDAVSRATVSAVGGDVSVPTTSVGCDSAAIASSLPTGTYSGTIGLYAGPDLLTSYTCAGEVLPGITTELSCIPD